MSTTKNPTADFSPPWDLVFLFYKIAVHPAALVKLREVYPGVSVPGAFVIDLNLVTIVLLFFYDRGFAI